MRTTALMCFQRRKHVDSDFHKRFNKFREHSEKGCKLQNADCKVQIEVLIDTIPA